MSSPNRQETSNGLHASYDGRIQQIATDIPARPPDSLTLPDAPELGQGLGGQPTAVVAVPREKALSSYLSQIDAIERRAVELAVRFFEPAARIAIFVIYFWFGILKVLGLSPATPLAQALTAHTIGMQYFTASFNALSVFECLIGLMILVPALTRITLVLIIIHMGLVSSPLVIVSNVAFTHPGVPTLEGQYIIKNLAIIALAIGILAYRRQRQSDKKKAVA